MTKLEQAAAKYRRTYDRLYLRSMQAGSAEESAEVDRLLAKANAEYEAAKLAATSDVDERAAYQRLKGRV